MGKASGVSTQLIVSGRDLALVMRVVTPARPVPAEQRRDFLRRAYSLVCGEPGKGVYRLRIEQPQEGDDEKPDYPDDPCASR